ncbi:MAG: response regulator transcription factor [Pseudomonadales bacterium]|nr:response regulator transcription factor [Pseudomonadales bacterium]
MKIWLLEDDSAQAELLTSWLQDKDHDVTHFPRAADIQEQLRKEHPDLFVLDWELPDGSGLDVVRGIRDKLSSHIPVLFVTQRDSEADIVEALSSGADDYMVKQIGKGEFLARVQALGRRLGNEALEFEVGPYRFFPETQAVTHNGEAVTLTAKDFELAHYLFRNVGRLLSRDELLREVWGVSGIHTRTVDMHMSRIRKALDIRPEGGFRIRTIYRHGYRLEQL